ncbi:pathogen-related protein [Apiospora marii]|uniref:pathogen-related protein n=1 Tax=Apiospora marii TaxID=335849 RepID=UPI00312F09FA
MADLPDYMTDPNAVLGDADAEWRHGQPPDYSKTRKVFEQTKQTSHAPGSLPDLVQNLVKNWEIEASFKKNLRDWRTVDPDTYTFSVNGGPPQPAAYMLKVGTYNAIIGAPNAWYSPRRSDLASSHKTFKRMMPTFAWEVLEVYGGPPRRRLQVAPLGRNEGGLCLCGRITAKAHGGTIDIQGVTVAHLNDKFQVTKLETWFDPVEMFRQIAPEGSALSQQSSAALAGAAAGCPVMAGSHGVSSDDAVQGASGNVEATVVLEAATGKQP